MKKFLLLASCAVTYLASGQESRNYKIANFARDSYGQPAYESFTFSEEQGRASEITYRYGADAKEIKLKNLGAATVNGKKGFKVAFPNKLQLYVFPNNNGTLTVTDRTKKYNKIFGWEYEGPVNGIGTHCEACVDEQDAIPFLKKYYLK